MKIHIFLYTVVILVLAAFLFTGCGDSTSAIKDDNGCAELIPDTGFTISVDTLFMYNKDFEYLNHVFTTISSVTFNQDSLYENDYEYHNQIAYCVKSEGITYVKLDFSDLMFYAFDSTRSWVLKTIMYIGEIDEVTGNYPYTINYIISNPENCPLLNKE